MEKKTRAGSFVDEISAIPGGEGIRLCIQCGTCTASCPNADRVEHTPSQLIAKARAGMQKRFCPVTPCGIACPAICVRCAAQGELSRPTVCMPWNAWQFVNV